MKNKKKNHDKEEKTHIHMWELRNEDVLLYQLLEGMTELGQFSLQENAGWRVQKMDSYEHLRTEYAIELLKDDRIHSYHFCVGYAQEMYYKNKHDKKD